MKREGLRVEQCPKCSTVSNLVLLKPEVCVAAEVGWGQITEVGLYLGL